MTGLYDKIGFGFIAANILVMYLQGTIQRRKDTFTLEKESKDGFYFWTATATFKKNLMYICLDRLLV